MRFEWDQEKNNDNLKRHQVSFEEAIEAFGDVNRVLHVDLKHSSESEKRYFLFGLLRGRVLTVRFTVRDQEVVRIIGAGFWRKGRKIYESEQDAE